MCGIVGILRFDGANPREDLLRTMVQSIAHRGPDGEGTLIRDGVALGHRRLSIIDLAAGRQPMGNEDGEVQVTYNGEIYNYRELRRELEAAGHQFRTQSDTEVIVHAYEAWGPECVRRFRGMFAFALADFRGRKLLLARDHFGIKPLYYRLEKNFVAFGSEIPPVLAAGDRRPAGRLKAIDYFLQYRFIPPPDTIYEGVYKLPPASYRVFDFSGASAPPVTYWELQFAPESGGSDEDWLREFDAVVEESVSAHLVADVPFGVFLSGGIDSTLVARHMRRLLPGGVEAFTIGFENQDHSEVAYAQEAATKLGLTLHEEIIRPDDVELFVDLAARYGEPYADSSAMPTWYVSRLARRHVPMVLSGDGGDEIFAGYSRYEEWMQRGVRPCGAGLFDRPRHWWQSFRRAIHDRSTPPVERLQEWQGHYGGLTADGRRNLWRAEHRGTVNGPAPRFADAARHARRFDRLAFGQYLDFAGYLPGDVLLKVDVASMAHGLEVRTPLVDLRVVEFAARLPERLRLRRNVWGDMLAKVLPKQSLAADFPQEFVHRTKRGFNVPERDWLRPGSRLRSYFDDLLQNSRSRVYDLLDRDRVQACIGQFDAERRCSSEVWVSFLLAAWLEQNREVAFE